MSTSFLCIASCGSDTIEVKNATTIWQGFHHVWEYNHRVNRMGDWLTDIDYDNGYSANSYHSAASGIGPDKCDYSTFLTQLKTSKDNVINAKTELEVFKKEFEQMNQNFTLSKEIGPAPLTTRISSTMIQNARWSMITPSGNRSNHAPSVSGWSMPPWP